MVTFELLKDKGILIVTPHGALEAWDFANLAKEIDPYIEENGKLNGLMLCPGDKFPGWEDFAALIAHFKFVKNHHRNIKKVAAVTDSKFLTCAPKIASHFVQAEVKHFDSKDRAKAMEWLEAK
ncbi:MAG TPA: hypothetical protein DCZ94_02970 [Lentisphaeria bacterium]|nr:MAG: hypothetical protein A2X48_15795 [Lentisphaerae bacterium GWF2_49_21]HBC85896.1 hypothetical protein [Lentisphaeria bacterium]